MSDNYSASYIPTSWPQLPSQTKSGQLEHIVKFFIACMQPSSKKKKFEWLFLSLFIVQSVGCITTLSLFAVVQYFTSMLEKYSNFWYFYNAWGYLLGCVSSHSLAMVLSCDWRMFLCEFLCWALGGLWAILGEISGSHLYLFLDFVWFSCMFFLIPLSKF